MGLFDKLFKKDKKEAALNPEETLDLVAAKDPNERIEYYYEIKEKISGWSNHDKALLYRWIGKACDAGSADEAYRKSTVALSFYAASLALDSRFERDCWIVFDIKYGFPASQANAFKLRDHYPLPETLEEARNYAVAPIYGR